MLRERREGIRRWRVQKGAEHQSASGGGFPWYAGTSDLTEGTTADCSEAIALIEDIEAEHLLADEGYDSNEVVEAALALGMNPVIPPRSNRKTPRVYDRAYLSCDIWWKTPFST